jgi:hypothetical protein
MNESKKSSSDTPTPSPANSASTTPASKSKNWLAGSMTLSGRDPLLAWMERKGISLTKANYLSLAHPEGVPEHIHPEEMADLPPELTD